MQLRKAPKIGRNLLCPCNSGKKYKKCCFIKNEAEAEQQREIRRKAEYTKEQKSNKEETTRENMVDSIEESQSAEGTSEKSRREEPDNQ